MKRSLRILFLELILASAGLVMGQPVIAKTLVSEGVVSVPANEVVQDDLFIGAEKVEVLGRVEGDVFVGGGEVRIAGEVTGDVYIGGGTLTLENVVGGSVFAAGGNILLNGVTVGNDVLIGGGNVQIDGQSRIDGQLVAGVGNLQMAGNVGRNLIVGAGNLSLDGQVQRDALLGIGSIQAGSGARVAGTMHLPANIEESLSPNATFAQIERYQTPEGDRNSPKDWEGVGRGLKIFSFLSALVLGALALWLFPKQVAAGAERIRQDPGRTLLWGMAAMFLIPFVLVGLLVTIVGIPVAMMLLGLFVMSLYFAKIFVALALGEWIESSLPYELGKNRFFLFVIGLIAYYVLMMIPIIGGLVMFIGTVLGLGALVLSLGAASRDSRNV